MERQRGLLSVTRQERNEGLNEDTLEMGFEVGGRVSVLQRQVHLQP